MLSGMQEVAASDEAAQRMQRQGHEHEEALAAIDAETQGLRVERDELLAQCGALKKRAADDQEEARRARQAAEADVAALVSRHEQEASAWEARLTRLEGDLAERELALQVCFQHAGLR
jgi:chromosome segregation ATPase